MITVGHKKRFCQIKLRDILAILCSAAIPVALAVYTSINTQREQEETEKSWRLEINRQSDARRQLVFEMFINNIYKLDKDGYISDEKSPWAFANAFYRAAHRQLDPMRKGDLLQFLKERKLIGRQNCTDECQKKIQPDIIRLIALNFDDIQLISQTGLPGSINLDCILLEQVSMNNAAFSSVNMNGAVFEGGVLASVVFDNVNLACTVFDGTNLTGVDFGNSNLSGVVFSNVDLSGAKLTEEQQQQATFHNSRLPDGRLSGTSTGNIITSHTFLTPILERNLGC